MLRQWPSLPGLRSMDISQCTEIFLGLHEEGCPTTYANGVASIGIWAVVGIDDVIFSFDETEATAPAGRGCCDVHILMDDALPYGADLYSNRGAVLGRDGDPIGIVGMLNQDDSARKDGGELLQLFAEGEPA